MIGGIRRVSGMFEAGHGAVSESDRPNMSSCGDVSKSALNGREGQLSHQIV